MADDTRAYARTPSPTGLYCSERGEISCARHTPYEGSDTWNWERWIPMYAHDAQGHRDLGHTACCETCGREADGG